MKRQQKRQQLVETASPPDTTMQDISRNNLALLTDLYQLTMAASYFHHHMSAPATFSLFVRNYPPDRGFFVAAGLAEAISYLEHFAFSPEELEFLASTKLFRLDFLAYLSRLRFTGDVYAMPEGRVFFTNEPLVEVTAPIVEAQIVETYLINTIHLQSLIATKAARCLQAAKGRSLVDFALRRTHGTDAGLKVARASFIGGFDGTSNVLAGKLYGIPIVGTMAHSFIISFDDESEAFRAYAETFPDSSALLIDTYDTIAGAHRAAKIGQELAAKGHKLRGVRLDSGDLLTLSQETRKILNAAGLKDARIYASGGLNEYQVEQLTAAGAPIDVFGVGTEMGTSGDAPWLDMAYKLVEYAGKSRLKTSTKKISYLGKKQVYRLFDTQGLFAKDLLALREEILEEICREACPEHRRREGTSQVEPLLHKVMEGGKLCTPLPSLTEARETFLGDFRRLPDVYKALRHPPLYPVVLTPRLASFQERAVRAIQERLGES